MIRALWLALIVFVATPAVAEQNNVYEGVVGTAHVVLQLTDERSEILGAYFYRSSRLDIELSGHRHGQAMDLTSPTTNDQLSLERSGSDLVGVLLTQKGRKFTIRLHPAASPTGLPADLPAGLDLYERWRLAGLNLIPQEKETQNGKVIRWYREPVTGIRLFRLESGYGAAAMAAMNRSLAQHQWSTVSTWLQCTGSDGKPGTDTDQSEKPWLGWAYVSYIWRSAWDCAGTAHPDFGAEGHSFDARSGRELTLDEVLPEGRGPIPPENSNAWLTYRGDVFAPAVVALMKRHHPAEMAVPKSDDDCDYTDPEVWDFPSWALTEKGLWLGAIFGRVMRACDSPEWSVIPWSALPAKSAARP
jgi:hypothetical protein